MEAGYEELPMGLHRDVRSSQSGSYKTDGADEQGRCVRSGHCEVPLQAGQYM